MRGSSPAGGLSGVVTDPDGSPVAGAWVTTEPGGVEAVTDTAGRYVIARLTPGSYRVVGAATGYAAGWSEVAPVAEGASVAVDVRLGAVESAAVGRLTLTVTGPDDAPIEGARVTYDHGGEVSEYTDADGVVVITGVDGQVLIDLVVSDAEAHWTRTLSGLAVPAGGNVDVAVQLAGRAAPDSGYSGGSQCVMCHAEIGEAWGVTAHASSMTAVVGEPAVAFDEALVVDLGGPSATFGWEDGAAVVHLRDIDGAVDTWPVSGFLGGEARGAVPWAERDGLAWPLPLAWVPAESGKEDWAPGGWTVGDAEPWFTAEGRFLYAGTPAADRSAEASCFGCHVTGYTLSVTDGVVGMRAVSRSGSRWDQGVVGCEACHGPGLDHTSGGEAGMIGRVTNPADLDTTEANDVCGQCHGALEGAEGTPFAWSATHEAFRPGMRLGDLVGSAYVDWGNGTAAVPNAMHDELALSGHGTGAWSARCTDCHDPHGAAYPSGLRLPEADNTLCSSCHLGLSFADDAEAMGAHTQHLYLPDTRTESGRCSGCHMPGTATRLAWSETSAAGDLASHRFLTVPPSDSVAAFDAAGVDTLAPGTFPVNGCQECHAWNDHYFRGGFPGPTGDFTTRALHEALATSYVEKYP